MRRGTRGRGSSSKDKSSTNSKMQWRPTLWKESGEQH
jgi:hypothetical protein